MIKNRIAALTYRCVSGVVVLMGLLVSFGLFTNEFSLRSVLFYTVQSNIIVLALFGYFIVRTATDLIIKGTEGSSSYNPRLEAGVVMAITLTFLVYWIMLAPLTEKASDLWKFSNLGVHAITPILCIIDYLLFAESGRLKKRDPLLFAIVPIVYFLQATILGFSGVVYYLVENVPVYFPYPFMNYHEIGGWVALFVALIAAGYIGLSYLLLLLDKKWKKPEIFLGKKEVAGEKGGQAFDKDKDIDTK